MREEEAWWLKAKCKELTTEEADALFFPGPGGKPNKADAYCSDCPMRPLCLNEAIHSNLPGFQGGTTEFERMGMRAFVSMTMLMYKERQLLEAPEPTGGVVLRLVETEDAHQWMDEVEPDDSVIQMMDSVQPESDLWYLVS